MPEGGASSGPGLQRMIDSHLRCHTKYPPHPLLKLVCFDLGSAGTAWWVSYTT